VLQSRTGWHHADLSRDQRRTGLPDLQKLKDERGAQGLLEIKLKTGPAWQLLWPRQSSYRERAWVIVSKSKTEVSKTISCSHNGYDRCGKSGLASGAR
jgi:hypothetical protein